MPSKSNSIKKKAKRQAAKIRQRSQNEGIAAHLVGFDKGRPIIKSSLGISRQAQPQNGSGLSIGQRVQLTRSNVPMFDVKPVNSIPLQATVLNDLGGSS